MDVLLFCCTGIERPLRKHPGGVFLGRGRFHRPQADMDKGGREEWATIWMSCFFAVRESKGR